MTVSAELTDWRWPQALTGLFALAFVEPRQPAVPAEITGIDGFYVYVVVNGEEEPRRLFWTDIRPCAPEVSDAERAAAIAPKEGSA